MDGSLDSGVDDDAEVEIEEIRRTEDSNRKQKNSEYPRASFEKDVAVAERRFSGETLEQRNTADDDEDEDNVVLRRIKQRRSLRGLERDDRNPVDETVGEEASPGVGEGGGGAGGGVERRGSILSSRLKALSRRLSTFDE